MELAFSLTFVIAGVLLLSGRAGLRRLWHTAWNSYTGRPPRAVPRNFIGSAIGPILLIVVGVIGLVDFIATRS